MKGTGTDGACPHEERAPQASGGGSHRFAGGERAYATPRATHASSCRLVPTCSASTRSQPVIERPRISIGYADVLATSASGSSGSTPCRPWCLSAATRAADCTLVETLADIAIRRLDAVDETQVRALAEVLVDAIDSDAGVSFLHPLEPERAQAFWRGVAEDVSAGARALLVAEDEGGIVGTVQLVLRQPENQPHRADLSKMLVHRRARRRGLGAALLEAAERTARECGKTLLVLDTNTGSDAERLYARMGWTRVGEIPDFSIQPRGGLRATTVFYKRLSSG